MKQGQLYISWDSLGWELVTFFPISVLIFLSELIFVPRALYSSAEAEQGNSYCIDIIASHSPMTIHPGKDI